MKLLRFGAKGKEQPGILDAANRIRDLSSIVEDIAGDAVSARMLEEIRAVDLNALPIVRDGVRLGSCIGGVRNFIAVGLNYSDHAVESKMPLPEEPVLFNKAPSCIVGPNDDVIVPPGSCKTDWEVELAVVIGDRASYVTPEHALEHVAGYCVCNDVSERAYQLEGTGQWMKGKGCPSFGPLGPWLGTKEQISDPQKLPMWLDVNGERMQSGSTATMIFGVKTLVSYISQFMILEPGDVITTGTPPGVGSGKKPPRFLKPGETISLGIEGLGQQAQRVVAWGHAD